jgi:hypothetical protein
MSKVREKNEKKALIYFQKYGNDKPTIKRPYNSGRKSQAD